MDAEAIQINRPQRKEKSDNKERMLRLYRSSARKGRRRATIKRADAEAIQIKGPQWEEKGDNKDGGGGAG